MEGKSGGLKFLEVNFTLIYMVGGILTVRVKFGGVDVFCVVDFGLMVFFVIEDFYRKKF